MIGLSKNSVRLQKSTLRRQDARNFPLCSVTMPMARARGSCCHACMDANDAASYLELTLEEEHAARISTTIEARDRHVEQAIAYEIRCLLTVAPSVAKGVERVELGPLPQ